MELQALRHVAVVSRMTFDQRVETENLLVPSPDYATQKLRMPEPLARSTGA